MNHRKLLAPTTSDIKSAAFKIYEKARHVAHWNPKDDIDYDKLSPLSLERQELAWRVASQGVYTEQVGMMVAAKLLNEVDDLAIRYCLATAVSDEAKHSEVFARYALIRGGNIDPVGEQVNTLFSELETIKDPFGRFVAHSLIEELAADEFAMLRIAFKGDVLEEIYSHVGADEARHTAIGMDYMSTVLRDSDFEKHACALKEYGQAALEISGANDYEMYVWLANLVNRTPDYVQRWMLSRHHKRISRLLVVTKEEVPT